MTLKDKLLGGVSLPPTTTEEQPKEQPKPVVKQPASMADRIRQANKMAASHPSWMTVTGNDVALLLDDSCSMGECESNSSSTLKIDRLNQGISLFADEIDFHSSRVTFIPMNAPNQDFTSIANMKAARQRPTGGTPMGQTIKRFGEQSANQGVLISDGEADDSSRAIHEAKQLQGKRIDCIHIGTSASGESTLKQIAEITGGMFFKFKDVSSFAASLKELAPKRRAALASKSAEEIKFLTGATEVIK